MNTKTIGFIGCGNMGCAILRGLLTRRLYSPKSVWVYEIDPKKRQNLRKRLRVQLAEHPVLVNVDEGLLKQALLNLMINATQAMALPEGARDADGSAGSAGELILHVEGDEKEARVRTCANNWHWGRRVLTASATAFGSWLWGS